MRLGKGEDHLPNQLALRRGQLRFSSLRYLTLHLIERVANADPLTLIEYWAVDPDCDGQVFRSVW
ncbi:hypothetical protein [Comamonas flocculans]|uniref:hypothetical protein n=1 Tax=Comamonas flocculans TaxID=2597701 RepID=UPI001C96B1FF|nr:hypothetical protein [Comamonas flocculans]